MWITFDGEDPVKVNTDFVTVIYPKDKKVVLSCGTQIIFDEKSYSKLEAKMFAKRKVVAKDDTELYEFLNKLHQLLGNKGSISLTGDRRKGFEKLFADGFTKEQIITAATNIGNSEWMRGKNDRNVVYAKVDYLFRKTDGQTWNINKWQEAQVKKPKKMF